MFNVSERQLFCIARAILIQSPIVVYDGKFSLNCLLMGHKIEPAVTVDRDTERLIQQVMNENFSQCTVIFLATRFRVIVQMDRVMVMKHGEIVEFDTPLALLDNPKSKFSLMLSQTGDVDPVSLRQLAQKKATAKENGGAPAMFRTGSKSSGSSAIPNTLNHLFPGATSNSFKSYSSQEDSDGRRLSNEQRVLTVPSSDLRNIIVIPAENESQREKQ
jgi:ABC-type glutathione transport system ATPase component